MIRVTLTDGTSYCVVLSDNNIPDLQSFDDLVVGVPEQVLKDENGTRIVVRNIMVYKEI